jgi:hypothetical protein
VADLAASKQLNLHVGQLIRGRNDGSASCNCRLVSKVDLKRIIAWEYAYTLSKQFSPHCRSDSDEAGKGRGRCRKRSLQSRLLHFCSAYTYNASVKGIARMCVRDFLSLQLVRCCSMGLAGTAGSAELLHLNLWRLSLKHKGCS